MNAFGEVIATRSPTGVRHRWCKDTTKATCTTADASVPKYSYYKENVEDAAPDTRVYFEIMGREIVQATQGADGQWRYKLSTFTANNRAGVAYAPTKNLTNFLNEARNKSANVSYDIYNGLGELIKQTDASGQVIENRYDTLGRLVQTISHANNPNDTVSICHNFDANFFGSADNSVKRYDTEIFINHDFYNALSRLVIQQLDNQVATLTELHTYGYATEEQRTINTGYLAAMVTKGYLPTTQCGYTGHEMLNNVNIIHMNGRIYDPTIGRFLQADTYIQAPDNLQNYNRYSYVHNNPMSYTATSDYFLD